MWFYNFGLILYVWAIRLVAPRHPKARLWIEGRKDLFRRMREAIAPHGQDRLDTRRVARGIRTGPPHHRTASQDAPRIQDSPDLLLTFGLRNPQELQGRRLHLLPPARHAAQCPPLPRRRTPRNRHFRQIRVLAQPAPRTAPPENPHLRRVGHLPPQFGLFPSLRRHVAAGAGVVRRDVRAERGVEETAGDAGFRQRAGGRRHAFRPCGGDRPRGQAHRRHRPLQGRQPAVHRRLDVGTGRRTADQADERQSRREIRRRAPRNGRVPHRTADGRNQGRRAALHAMHAPHDVRFAAAADPRHGGYPSPRSTAMPPGAISAADSASAFTTRSKPRRSDFRWPSDPITGNSRRPAIW